jgi:hypothetical protein
LAIGSTTILAQSSKDAPSSASRTQETTYLKDSSVPDGKACCEDSTLKDASEMTWLHSPSQEHSMDREKRKRDKSKMESEAEELPKFKVSKTTLVGIGDFN